MYAEVGLYELGMIGEAFLFEVPGNMELVIGDMCEVEVQGKPYRGVVIELCNQISVSYTVKPIIRKIDHPLGSILGNRSELLKKIARCYYSPFHKVVRLGIPENIWLGTYEPKYEAFYIRGDKSEQKLTPKLKEFWNELEDGEIYGVESLLLKISKPLFKKAVELGLIKEESRKLLPVQTYVESDRGLKRLTQEQEEIVGGILGSAKKSHLIHAVTGAGKTEIYAHLAIEMRKQGKASIILVPEIALTPQLLGYFMGIFGERIAVFHSKLSAGDKCQEWVRVQNGDVDVVIGSRSALFGPIANLGLVVVDEEHEWTYKNEQHPRYYIHRVLSMMQEIDPGLHVVFGSATPRIESMYKAQVEGGDTGLLTLEKKIYEQTPL